METVVVGIREDTGVAEARRKAVAVASHAGLNKEQTGRVALIATEAATNLLRHAGQGELLVRTVAPECVEIIALDTGPGIPDLMLAMRDGYSTQGGAGTGLGAIVRLASEHDIYTSLGMGTALLARVFPDRTPLYSATICTAVEFGGVAVPMHGETECGDAFQVHASGTGACVILADGLGHGPLAAEASLRAVAVFEECSNLALDELMERIHLALRSTRGAAIALAHVSTVEGVIRFVSVGNVSGAIVAAGGGVRQMISFPGTVGHELRKVRQFTYDFPPGATIVLHSDGIVSRWSMEPYPGLAARDPTLIAAILYRDFHRERDDATVLILRRHNRAEAPR